MFHDKYMKSSQIDESFMTKNLCSSQITDDLNLLTKILKSSQNSRYSMTILTSVIIIFVTNIHFSCSAILRPNCLGNGICLPCSLILSETWQQRKRFLTCQDQLPSKSNKIWVSDVDQIWAQTLTLIACFSGGAPPMSRSYSLFLRVQEQASVAAKIVLAAAIQN